MKSKFSSFSILACFACLCIIGASMIPLLSVQLNPTKLLPSVSVSFSWHDASAKVIEQEVTSKLEGVFNTVNGIKEINSTTNKENGSINIKFKKNTDLDAVRFEIANLIRQTYTELPEGVSYPQLSISGANENNSPVLAYSINANESPYLIKKYAENQLLPKLAIIKGVNKVFVYGADPFDWCIKYDSDKLIQLSISVNEIENAIRQYFQTQQLGNGSLISKNNAETEQISVVLNYKFEKDIDWDKIPIKKIGNRIIYLKNIAEVQLKEAPMKSYFRINGKNSINMVVYAENGANTIEVANTVKEEIEHLKKEINEQYSLKLTNDTSEYITKELQKIQEKMLFSLLILFFLILITSRSFKHILILFLSIIANLLIAVIFYKLFEVELQLYSFAGITISFGIIIDNCIIMIDHLKNKGDKKVFLAILATTLTTTGALLSTFLLDESLQANLRDFTLVIAINIVVSLFIALFFVPALLQKIGFNSKRKVFSRKRKRRIVQFTGYYYKLISALKRPAFKWLFIVVLIISFGLPLHLFPKEMKGDGFLEETYNKTIGNEWFYDEIKPILEKIIGGSLRLFTEDVYENSHYSDPERTTLRVSGSMPEGCTIEQLNEVIIKMENYISSFDEVEMFETNIGSYKNSTISIYFKKENEFSGFPFKLKSLLESKAISLGGLDWSVSGVGQGFSNALVSDYKNNRIVIEGYNYDKLYSYAELLKSQLIHNSASRITDVDITNGDSWGNANSYEYFLEFDTEKMAMGEVYQTGLYSYLKNQTHAGGVTSFVRNNELQQVKLVSDQYQKVNVWDLKHVPISIGNNQYKLDQMAEIEKRKTGNSISKFNQQYRLTIAYDFIGTEPLAQKVRENNIEELKTRLPIGYRVFEQNNDIWDKTNKQQYYFILVVILIIYFICSILLESLKQPFAIISMIPISFIGVFLTFYLFDFNFDQGGYASFILLCGISVNAALYIINDYNNFKKQYPHRAVPMLYFKAFNYKIIPVMLTILSTVTGLIPFVWGGQNESFWFSFAAGSIGGLLFSLLGIFIYLPIFIVDEDIRSSHQIQKDTIKII
ncbi:Multidrug efflux pump subunit AcrB [Flavobacterium resistens]|uniref:AcrB/AcrD/AcrF family protein n=1 Tax=Flavobacterium resistens TaxID=443612 RepID=A0A521F9I7_9FLAO|nr:efflux RND transporter permease subunit [Flavobacterium resistens]MRX70074.1 AcrB/AcrD/AcrF family protein [Flavobacterium resistens]SMO92823.1 Multidrug efflux pump subunit AcrB [Flavobacterium resistens]